MASGPPAAVAATITIGSFEGPRSGAPFATASSALGYTRLRSSLLDPANFGPDGLVQHTVEIAPGTQTITDAYLADKTVFITSIFTGVVSAQEGDALRRFVLRGGCVLVDTDTGAAENTAARSMLQQLSINAGVGPSFACSNSATGGTIPSVSTTVTDGPFGLVVGGSFATSQMAAVIPDGRDRLVVVCDSGISVGRAFMPAGTFGADSGLVMYGGDPSGVDHFTIPGSGNYNPNNEIIYLNAISQCATDDPPCPLTKGFWKNHPGSWPVEELTLGCREYTKDELLALLLRPARSNVSTALAHQLIAARLNLEAGSDPSPVEETIARADALLCEFRSELPFDVPRGRQEQAMKRETNRLRDYNLVERTPICGLTYRFQEAARR
jgi:hypothetical protein